MRGEEISKPTRTEAIKVLETALEREDDPLWWDLTLYNLINMLLGVPGREEEAYRRLDDFRTRFYRRRWYVERLLGVQAWRQAERHRDHGDPEEARRRAVTAARHYALAIRRRRRLYPRLSQEFPFVALPSLNASPILHANLVDAHALAGHPVRVRWQELRFHSLRKRYMLRAFKALDRDELDRAYALLDWSLVGRKDEAESSAWVWKMIVMKLRGDAQAAEQEWQRAKEYNPFVYLARAWIWKVGKREIVRKTGMPGSEPLDVDSAIKAFERDWDGPPFSEYMIPMPGSF